MILSYYGPSYHYFMISQDNIIFRLTHLEIPRSLETMFPLKS